MASRRFARTAPTLPTTTGEPAAFGLTARVAAALPTYALPARMVRRADLLGPGGLDSHAALADLGDRLDLRSAAPRDRPGVLLTLAEARAAATRDAPGGSAQDLLLLSRARPAVHGGTARLRPGQAHDEVAAFEVTTAGRASNEMARALLVPRLTRWQRPHRGGDAWRTPLPPWGMRLGRLLRAVRPHADGGLLEWADDGHRCWVLLVHPPD